MGESIGFVECSDIYLIGLLHSIPEPRNLVWFICIVGLIRNLPRSIYCLILIDF